MSNIILEYIQNELGFEIAKLTINRPDQLNALNLDTIDEIGVALDELGANQKVRALIITGAGEKSFAAGADITQIAELTEKTGYELSKKGNAVFSKLAEVSFPTIAVVNGFALGGGCELAISCDIRLASENASFSLPEVNLGVCPGWGGTQRFARLIGTGHASELLFSAGRIDANQAEKIGLVNQVYPAEKLMEEALKLAGKIGKMAPLAVATIKQAMYEGIQKPLQEGLEIEAKGFSKLFNTADAKGGLQAFLNKEKYTYKGE